MISSRAMRDDPGRWRIVVVAVVVAGLLGSVGALLTSSRGNLKSQQLSKPSWTLSFLGGSYNSVSCASAEFCAAAYSSPAGEYVVTFDGREWSSPVRPAKYRGQIASIACPAQGVCVAVSNLGEAASLRDGVWSTLSVITATPALTYPGTMESISCGSPTMCVEVNGLGSTATLNAGRWSSPRSLDETDALNAISCVNSTFCIAADGGGNVVVLDHGTWLRPRAVDPDALTSISCASEQFCVASDLLGRAITFNGATWSKPQAIDTASNSPLSIACPLPGNCIATDGAGRARLLRGSTWGRFEDIDPRLNTGTQTPSLVALGCAPGTLSLCAAGDNFGDAEIGRAPFSVNTIKVVRQGE